VALAREVAGVLGLERLALRLEVADGLGRRQGAPGEGLPGGDDLPHPLLDLRQVLGRERLVEQEVVVEAVLGRRPEAELGAGAELPHRLGQDVGERVPPPVERIRLVARRHAVVGAAIVDLGRAGGLVRLLLQVFLGHEQSWFGAQLRGAKRKDVQTRAAPQVGQLALARGARG
jgi:hypothetical protein